MVLHSSACTTETGDKHRPYEPSWLLPGIFLIHVDVHFARTEWRIDPFSHSLTFWTFLAWKLCVHMVLQLSLLFFTSGPIVNWRSVLTGYPILCLLFLSTNRVSVDHVFVLFDCFYFISSLLYLCKARILIFELNISEFAPVFGYFKIALLCTFFKFLTLT